MAARFFLDTNIFVYTFDANLSKRKRASQLVRQAADTGEGIISYQVVQEFFNVALRRFAQPMSVAEAEQYLISAFRPLLAVHSSPALYFEALRISGKYRISWYDALIVAAAIQGQCAILYSEDLSHGQEVDGIRIRNPFL